MAERRDAVSDERGGLGSRMLRSLWYLGTNRLSVVGIMLTTASAATHRSNPSRWACLASACWVAVPPMRVGASGPAAVPLAPALVAPAGRAPARDTTRRRAPHPIGR